MTCYDTTLWKTRLLSSIVQSTSPISTPLPPFPRLPNTRHTHCHYISSTIKPQLPQHRPPHTLPLRPTHTRPPPLHAPVPPDKKLLKVPLDPLQAEHAGLLGLEPVPQRLRRRAVDVDLGKNGERDAVVALAEGVDVVVGAWVLRAELVAGEG